MTAHEYALIDSVDSIIHTFGSVGRGVGQFDHPRAASSCSFFNEATDKLETFIAVTDTGNSRIQILYQNGMALRTLGNGNGEGPNQLDNPGGLDWGGAESSDPCLAVADQNNNRIQIWVDRGSEHLGSGSCYGTKGVTSSKKKGNEVDQTINLIQNDKEKSNEEKREIGADYQGQLTAELYQLKLNKPGGVCWVESGSGNNWLVIADTYNNRLQFLDLDKGYVRVLCGREKVLGPSSVVYHNGWRWCSGAQAVAPPLVHEAELPDWFIDLSPNTTKNINEIAARQLLDSYKEEKQRIQLVFEEKQAKSGGLLAEAELRDAIEMLFGDFRIWRKNSSEEAPNRRVELTVGVFTVDVLKQMELSKKLDRPLRLNEFPISVLRTPEGQVDKFYFKGRAYTNLYKIINNIGLISKTRWNYPAHRGILAVAEANISRVSIMALYSPQFRNEYFVPFVQSLGPVNGGELSGFREQNVLDRPLALAMSPFGDLAIGDKRASDVGGSRIVIYNVLNNSVNAVIQEPFIERGDNFTPVLTVENEEGEQVFADRPLLIPAILPNGALFVVEAESKSYAMVLRRPNPPAGRCGDFLSLLPSKLMNEFILPHLTYRNAEQARCVCRYLHDWTKKRRDQWLLWPLQPLGLKRIRMLFVDWARLGDGRSLKSQHPKFRDSQGGVICPRFLEGRCEAGDLCDLSHEVPEVDESAILRKFEEICFLGDARPDYIGATFQEKHDLAVVTKLENGGNFDRARVRPGWRVSRIGKFEVRTLRSMEEAFRYYRDLPSACDWPVGSHENEYLLSSKRPIKICCEQHEPDRPYVTTIEFGSGFFCACTEFLGLPFWWEHEYEIRELFMNKADLFYMDERRDQAQKGLEVRFELSSFRIIFKSLFPTVKPSLPLIESSRPTSSSSSNSPFLSKLPPIKSDIKTNENSIEINKKSISSNLTPIYSGNKISQPYAMKDGLKIKNPNKLSLKNEKYIGIGNTNNDNKDRGLKQAPNEPPPEQRGLGLNQLESHILQFDYQNQKLDAMLSRLF